MTPVAGCAAGDRVAALPMYDLPGLEAANNALWLAVASRLTANGIHNVPPNRPPARARGRAPARRACGPARAPRNTGFPP